MHYQIDAIDRRILHLLQKDGKIKIKEIAAALKMTNTPIFDRIKRLEKEGYIKGYTAVIDHGKLGFNLIAFCTLTLEKHHIDSVHMFERDVLPLEEVVSCYHIAGRYDYLLKIMVRDMKDYQVFITEKLASLVYIRRVQSSFVMTEIKQEWSVPVPT